MIIKILGATLILAACGGVGFKIAANYIKEERTIRQLIYILDFMSSEMQYRLTPLPELCKQAANESKGVLSRVFAKLSEEMVNQIAPNVSHCMSAALSSRTDIPPTTAEMLQVLGNSLGRFDMNGQLRGLDAVRSQCKEKLNDLIQNKDVRLRSYKTLGLCAGAAMVILFI